jgi:predicted nucleotidyltransferase
MRLKGSSIEPDHPDSDLDIGVLPERDRYLTVEAKVLLAFALEELFGVSRVDLVVLPQAPPFLALEIIRGELLFTRDAREEAEYQLYVLRRAGDLVPWERQHRRMLLEGEAF